MIGQDLTFVLGRHQASAAQTERDPVERFVEVGPADHLLARSGGNQCGFIGQVFEVCTGEHRGRFCHPPKVDIFCNRFVAYMNLEDVLSFTLGR